MKTLSKYLNEKLIINKNYKSGADRLIIPKNTHITGEESYGMVIKTIKEYIDKDFADKVDMIFNGIQCKAFEYCWFIGDDDEDDYKKGIGKIFPNGLRSYSPSEYINLDNDDDDCPDNWDDYNSLAKFETVDRRYVIVWIVFDRNRKSMYAFINKL